MTSHHQSKPNQTTMHPLIILLALLLAPAASVCKPNQQQPRTDYDKSLVRKPADENSQQASASGAQANFQCPEQFGYYTDTRDCTKYYVCVFGEVLHESCTGGLRFSRELQTCDWPRNVECVSHAQNGSQVAPGASSGAAPAATTTAASAAKQSAKEPEEVGEERAHKSSSMVFADEGSDPQQPSFDEAVSPVITPDGAIHLHDGSGGTYSLAPNHNRQMPPPVAAPSRQQQQPQEGSQNVDVFVKPIVLAGAAGSRPRPGQQARAGAGPKIQPATLPEQRAGQQHRSTLQQLQRQQNLQQQAPPTTTLHSLSNNNDGGDDKRDNEEDSETTASTEDPSSLDSQADQESSAEQQDSSGNNDDNKSSRQAAPTGAYIPPVSAPNPQRAGGRQSSQLLSINNRQLTDSRQSFKPILVATSNEPPTAHHSGQPAPSSLDDFQANSNQRSQAPFAFSVNNNHDESGAARAATTNNLLQEDGSRASASSVRQNNKPASAHRNNQHLQQPPDSPVGGQGGRPSRMSAFQAQQFAPSSGSGAVGERQPQQVPPSNRFLSAQSPPSADQSLSSNVNFNDTSKLIRLQASQFEPMQPHANSDGAGGSSFLKFPLPGSRSQNVLFSQQPFGFVADSSGSSAGNSNAEPLDGRFDNVAGSLAGDKSGHPGVAPLLQQQRRPRPPKRQQIPSGSQRRPSSQRTADEAPATTSQPSTTTNSFLSALDASYLDGSGEEQPARGPQPARPLVAPTTVSFQQEQPASQFGGATTAASVSTTNSRRFNEGQLAGLRGQNPPPTPPQRTTTEWPPQTSPNLAGSSTPASGQEDPQTLANNRYLTPNLPDALDPGQPFGTVDYDFDILGDNSTERRSPASGQPAAQSGLANQTAPANRQRQQQASFGVQDDDSENINLTNGQPSNQIRSSARQQPTTRQRASGQGRQQQQVAGGSPTGGQFAQQQQDSFASNLPQTTASASAQPSAGSQSAGQSPTKKPRPTNKKINVNHEQAIANNRASTEPAKRPEALFATPSNALQTATKCDNRVCRLPDCKCGDTLNPGGLEAKVIPQVVLLTFDDAVNDLNWEIYEELFTGRTNPNGCPILATFYVSHEWTDYGQVQTLYSRGHEMASHSVTHSFGEKFSKNQWFKEVNGQREILNMYGGVKMSDVRGMRAPFLQIGGNKMFEMLYDANFTYDSSMPIFENSPPMWPYTLDYQVAHECMITPCPTKSYPGVWEVGMTMWVDLRGGRCSMGDACSNPPDEDGVYEMLMKNFNRHYKSNRAPFGLFYHSAWFNTVHHRRGFLRFMGTVNSLSDVFFVTNWQMLQWMRQPTPLSEINSFEPWQCPAKTDRPPPCFHPSVCNVKSEHGTRFMKTCQPCPSNQQYPWVGSTGFKGKQASGSG